MSSLLAWHLLLTAAYAGFQWTIQLLVYRQFPLVPPEKFPAYEQAHQTRVSYVVGPLFLGLVVTTGLLLVERPDGTPWAAAVGAAVLLAGILAVTALAAVPLHARLGHEFSETAWRALLRWDLARAVLATANAGLALWLVLR
ncbi:MAG: DUF1772 domain-containing protein [Motilibacteraceae bacterium]